MALITLADWTCHINNCSNPLVRPSILKDFSRHLHSHTVPAAWVIAQKLMGSMKPPLHLLATDYSHILNGDVSIFHTLKIIKSFDNSCPSGSAAYSLQTAGFKMINQIGKWAVVNHVLKFLPFTIKNQMPHPKIPTPAARKNWNNITSALSNSNIISFFHGSIDLLTPRSQRRDEAEKYISELALTCNFTPSSLPHNNTFWATDGSMTPAASGLGDPKSITAAATGPTTLILHIAHQNTSILQGEQMGLITALVPSPQIYTDHLNSTMLIDDSRTAINQENRL